MNIYYSDEDSRLTSEIKQLMNNAAERAFNMEFGDVFSAVGKSAADSDAEIGVTVVSAEEIQELNREYRGVDFEVILAHF